jgi:uncharacterized membrane protein
MTVVEGFILAAAVTSGLNAGLYAAFSYAVMPGLRRTGDGVFVAAMRQINRAILNGWFAVVFGGAPALTILAAGLHPGPWLVTAAALHVAVLAQTFLVNVPLNNRLDNWDTMDASAARATFERPWVRANHSRAIVSTAALTAVVLDLIL